MMKSNLFEDIRVFLPKYLSSEEQDKLFSELKQFPDNLDKRFFTNKFISPSTLFQGDGIYDVLSPNYDAMSFTKIKGLLLTNTCDASHENLRSFYQPYLTFAPIFSLKKYEESLLQNEADRKKISAHIDAIRKQRVTSILYIPPHNDENIECFARFDCSFSVPSLENSIINNKIFTLSNYGFYLLLFKLSIHFSRVQEKLTRD